MGILIDADLIIQAERGRFDLSTWVASRPDEDFRLAAITVAELWHGVERATGKQRSPRAEFLERIFATLEIVGYTQPTALVHARLWAELDMRGEMIGPHDLILAATALERGDTLATWNARHFSRVTGLHVLSPA